MRSSITQHSTVHTCLVLLCKYSDHRFQMGICGKAGAITAPVLLHDLDSLTISHATIRRGPKSSEIIGTITMKMTTTTITLFTRHSAGCPHHGDSQWRSCNGRKSLYIYDAGKCSFKSTRTRSWEQAVRLAAVERMTRERIGEVLAAKGQSSFPPSTSTVAEPRSTSSSQPPIVRPAHPMFEQHYTIGKLAKLWGFAADPIRPWFEGEPGCLVIQQPVKMHKRGYRAIRVPQTVAERVYTRHTFKPQK